MGSTGQALRSTILIYFCLFHIPGAALATTLHVVNSAGQGICVRYWVPNNPQVGGGCRGLEPGQSWDVAATPAWKAATLWAVKGGCVSSCQTGPPTGVTQFEFTLVGGFNNDYYDLSTLAGFNLGMTVAPTNPSCPAQACPQPGSSCQGFVPGGPDRTKACRSGTTDYTIVFSN